MIEELQKIQKELEKIYNHFNKEQNKASYGELITFNCIYNLIQSINKLINK